MKKLLLLALVATPSLAAETVNHGWSFGCDAPVSGEMRQCYMVKNKIKIMYWGADAIDIQVMDAERSAIKADIENGKIIEFTGPFIHQQMGTYDNPEILNALSHGDNVRLEYHGIDGFSRNQTISGNGFSEAFINLDLIYRDNK